MDGQNSATPRPGMRRKSSASNLLASFQGNRNISTGMQTPTVKEHDVNSLFSEGSTGTSMSTLPIPPASLEAIREMLGRRILSLAHIRQGHEGKSHWLNTVLLAPHELEKEYNNVTMRKRTYKYAVLGMSLSNLFDIHTPSDFLRSLTTLLGEYDQLQDENYKPKMRNLLRGTKGSKRSGLGDYSDGDSSYLVIPNMPFPLDYFQVLISFCDILTEVYQKIRSVVGPSPLQQSGITFGAPPGSGYAISSPNPTSSLNPIYAQLFSPTFDHASLAGYGMEYPTSGSTTPNNPNGSGLSSPPPTWTSTLAESIVKIDNRFKKIINQLLKELDSIARNAIKDELSSLGPLLRNLGVGNAGDGYAGLAFDFEV